MHDSLSHSKVNTLKDTTDIPEKKLNNLYNLRIEFEWCFLKEYLYLHRFQFAQNCMYEKDYQPRIVVCNINNNVFSKQ